MPTLADQLGIKHVYVLMLENRSFDHMLGFSGITGTDAATGQGTAINGLTGAESNTFNGRQFPVTQGADLAMPTDPDHEFTAVLHQLCGPNAGHPPGGDYPPIDNSGYVASYMASHGADPAEIMKCYRPDQLPVLNALAREFVVCDNWHASMPGPTWPNRMFIHAASSGGLDHSPSVLEIVEAETVNGFHFVNGTIFDRLTQAGIRRRLYGGDNFPMVAALKGVNLADIRKYSFFTGDVADPNNADQYVFIEPAYDVLHDYKAGNSQHPLSDVTRGEALLKATYEAIRNSPAWTSSVLIVTWDEHGGFYDHAIPGPAPAPGDSNPNHPQNHSGFKFEQYGPRVPALVISPRIPKNLIDHRVYDHSSVLATIERLFGLNALTARDFNANRLDGLITLQQPRTDAPQQLPGPPAAMMVQALSQAALTAPRPVTRPEESVNEGNLPAIIQSAMQQDLKANPERREAILARVAAIQTRQQAKDYMTEVEALILPLRER